MLRGLPEGITDACSCRKIILNEGPAWGYFIVEHF